MSTKNLYQNQLFSTSLLSGGILLTFSHFLSSAHNFHLAAPSYSVSVKSALILTGMRFVPVAHWKFISCCCCSNSIFPKGAMI